MRVRVLINPKAGSGAATRQLPSIIRELERGGAIAEPVETRGPGDAARLVREAGADRVDCVAVVGGDGTLNEAVQAFVSPGGELLEGPPLAVIPCGTGGDFRRTFGLRGDVPDAVGRLLASEPRPIDLGVLRLAGQDGSTVFRAFANIASFGISGLTDRIVSSSPKWMGGRAAFFLATARALAVYRNAPVRVLVDGRLLFEGPVFTVAIANGRSFGGGMMIAPDADPNDGLFDVIALCDLSRARAMTFSRHIYRGTHLGEDGVLFARGASVSAESLSSSTDVLIDMDGEVPGRLPLAAHVATGHLRFRI